MMLQDDEVTRARGSLARRCEYALLPSHWQQGRSSLCGADVDDGFRQK